MTLIELKLRMLAACDDADKHHPGEIPAGFREAIEGLPDRTLVDALPIEFRGMLYEQLSALMTN